MRVWGGEGAVRQAHESREKVKKEKQKEGGGGWEEGTREMVATGEGSGYRPRFPHQKTISAQSAFPLSTHGVSRRQRRVSQQRPTG